MTWTTNKPTEAGRYWYAAHDGPELVSVVRNAAGVLVCDEFPVERMKGQWSEKAVVRASMKTPKAPRV